MTCSDPVCFGHICSTTSTTSTTSSGQIMLHMATSGQVSTSRHFRTAGLHMSLVLTVAF